MSSAGIGARRPARTAANASAGQIASAAVSAHPNAIKRGQHGAQRQRGAIAVIVALLLSVLLGFCALAVDIALGFVVRSELQNAADAAALAGAAKLFDPAAPASSLDWSGATTAATSAVALNQSSGITLEDATVVPGYWSVTGGSGELQSLPATPVAGDAPAVLVTVRRADGENGGPLPLHFARFLGVTSMPVMASAVAAVAPPGAVGEGVLFPLAVSACLYRNFWDATSIPPGPKNDPGTGQPYVFRIGPAYTYGSCTPGTWTSFGTDTGSTGALQAMMDSRNTALLKTASLVWMQTATDDSLYQSVDACSARGSGECANVIVPVVENVSAHAQDSITGFACLRLALAESGGDNYVQAVMSRHCKTRNAGGFGPDYGALATARLVR